jgi:site-specific recombinase XerD
LLHAHTWIRVSELLQTKLWSFNNYQDQNICIEYISKWWDIKTSLIEYRLFNLIKAYCDRYSIFKDDYVFHPLSNNTKRNIKSKSISISHYWVMLKYYWRKAWIEKEIKTHSIRATYITLLHLQWLNIQEIKDSVWHKSIQMTSHYIKSDDDSKKKSSRVMNWLLDY